MNVHEQILVLEKQKNYVLKNYKSLRQKYGNHYIAVKNSQVIDSDKDEMELAKRIELKFRDKAVLISTIEDIANPKISELPSPEICE